jgi:hypothetical protein
MLRHKNRGATKEELCQWVSLTLKKVLATQNIQKGFSKIGIFPFNNHTIDDKMWLAEVFQHGAPPTEASTGSEDSDSKDGDNPSLQEVLGDQIPSSLPDDVQFYMPAEDSMGGDLRGGSSNANSENDASMDDLPESSQAGERQTSRLLEFPRVGPPHKLKRHGEPLIDYSKSIILTCEGYMNMMQEKAAQKKEIATKKEERRLEAQRKRSERELQKIQKEAKKQQRAADAKAKEEFNARWTAPACA